MVDKSLIKRIFEESCAVKKAVIEGPCLDSLAEMVTLIVECYAGGGKILFCGNGGSAADAQHLACEFSVRYRSSVTRTPLPAIALALDPSTLTASGNDFGFEAHYERMVRVFGNANDLLFGLTTSGTSPNIVRALQEAKRRGMKTIGFLGCGGGTALAHCDAAFVVPSDKTNRVQESHITAGHAVIELAEDIMLERGIIKRE